MQRNQVKVGGVYLARLPGGLAPVQIRKERWAGETLKGWIGMNTMTNRVVKISKAQRLRPMTPKEAASMRHDAPGGEGTPGAGTAARSPLPPKAGGKARTAAKGGNKKARSSPKAGPNAARPAKAAAEPSPKTKGMSGLDAAAKILAESKKPMNCKVIVAEAFRRNLWKSEGATPEATIYAAIIREIAAKGDDARFKRIDRGQFATSKR